LEFNLPELPYSNDALDPFISPRTVEVHYGKHHRGYLDKLRKAIEDSPDSKKSLEELIRTTEGGIFNCAAQVWNHTFYWRSMRPGGGGKPAGAVLQKLESAYGSYEDFKQRFAEAANAHFGSGWAWLTVNGQGTLEILSTSDAENPIQRDVVPLLTVDVWEHAYYLDYQNERPRYVESFIDKLINWDFVRENLDSA
jgi:Fe-Mn family superoxide dismutase